MSNIMHVGVENPAEWRKEILGTAIDTIQALKEFEIYKRFNKEKSVYRKHFIQVVKELSKAIQEFKETMPVLHTTHPKEEKKAEPEKKVEVKKAPVIKRKKTHLNKLEDDISYLREKISKL